MSGLLLAAGPPPLWAKTLEPAPAAELIPPGAAAFVHRDRSETGFVRQFAVFTYRPASHGPEDPILISLHGQRRDAAAYRDAWIEAAERRRILVVAPQFRWSGFGWEDLRLGGVVSDRRAVGPDDLLPRSRWTFLLLDRLFDHIVTATGGRQRGYDLFGHSAGAQFAHRGVLFHPGSKALSVVAANAGWYTFPDERPFPDGIGGAAAAPPLGPVALRRAFAKKLIVLLGTADVKRGGALPKSDGAEAQGRHRLARGRSFMAAAKRVAAERGLPLMWERRYAEGVGHSGAAIAPFAARALYGDGAAG